MEPDDDEILELAGAAQRLLEYDALDLMEMLQDLNAPGAAGPAG